MFAGFPHVVRHRGRLGLLDLRVSTSARAPHRCCQKNARNSHFAPFSGKSGLLLITGVLKSVVISSQAIGLSTYIAQAIRIEPSKTNNRPGEAPFSIRPRSFPTVPVKTNSPFNPRTKA